MILCAFFSCTLLTLSGPIASASSSDDIYSHIAEAILLDTQQSNAPLAAYDPETLSFGDFIPAYQLEDNTIIRSNAKYVPIFLNQEIVAFAFVTEKSGNVIAVEITSDLVPELSPYISRGICLIFGATDTYVYDGSEIDLLKSYRTLYDVDQTPAVTNSIDEIGLLEALGNENDFSVHSLVGEYNVLDYDTSTSATRAYPVSYNVNAKVVPQYNYGICWAAAVAGIGYELTGTLKSARAVAEWMYGSDFDQGASPAAALIALEGIYGLDGVDVYTAPDFELIKQETYNNGHPIYTRFWEGSGSNDVRHAVFIDGYTDYASGSYIGCIFIGDSNYVTSVQNKYRTVYFSEDSVYPLTVNGQTTYANAHILLY